MVALRAGDARVGNTRPFLLVVACPSAESGCEGVVASGTGSGCDSVVDLAAAEVYRWCLKLEGRRAELRSSKTIDSNRLSNPFFSAAVLLDVVVDGAGLEVTSAAVGDEASSSLKPGGNRDEISSTLADFNKLSNGLLLLTSVSGSAGGTKPGGNKELMSSTMAILPKRRSKGDSVFAVVLSTGSLVVELGVGSGVELLALSDTSEVSLPCVGLAEALAGVVVLWGWPRKSKGRRGLSNGRNGIDGRDGLGELGCAGGGGDGDDVGGV